VRRALAISALWIVAAAPALASDEGHGGGADVLIKTGLNLLLLIGVLVYFARKPVAAYFAERRQTIEQSLATAATELSDAEATFSKWQRRLIDLESELEQVRAMARHRAEAERAKILSDARAGAERIQRNASAAIAQELRRAREQLREEATQLSIEMAGERLAREVTDADRARLVDEFIERVASDDAGAGVGQSREG